MSATYDLIIRNGEIITATDRMRCDIGVHAGRVRAEGEAPQAITWDIGLRRGERRLSASSVSATPAG